MARPSDPLLRWLRQRLSERKLSAAALAESASIDRSRVRHILAGHEAMTVDELLSISKALDLNPNDFGMGAMPEGTFDETDTEPEVDSDESTGTKVIIDALGNQPRQLFEVAFALGADFLFLANTAELSGSGVPAAVLDRYRDRDLPIKLDAAYHQYNNPKPDESGITLTLSFDALYDCRFPWTAVRQVQFYPAPPSAPIPDEPEEEEPPKKPTRPFLRLVE